MSNYILAVSVTVIVNKNQSCILKVEAVEGLDKVVILVMEEEKNEETGPVHMRKSFINITLSGLYFFFSWHLILCCVIFFSNPIYGIFYIL